MKYRTKHIAWITPSFPFGIKPATEAGLTFGKEVERLRKGFRLLKRNTGRMLNLVLPQQSGGHEPAGVCFNVMEFTDGIRKAELSLSADICHARAPPRL
ncbi:hypothetical protein [Komagataeibacter sp. NFXK3]